MDVRTLRPEAAKKLVNPRNMTVADLIEQLQQMPQEAFVGFQSCYGDYHRTQQFLPVQDVSELDEQEYTIQVTAYSKSGLCISEIDQDDDEEPETATAPASDDDLVQVVILS